LDLLLLKRGLNELFEFFDLILVKLGISTAKPASFFLFEFFFSDFLDDFFNRNNGNFHEFFYFQGGKDLGERVFFLGFVDFEIGGFFEILLGENDEIDVVNEVIFDFMDLIWREGFVFFFMFDCPENHLVLDDIFLDEVDHLYDLDAIEFKLNGHEGDIEFVERDFFVLRVVDDELELRGDADDRVGVMEDHFAHGSFFALFISVVFEDDLFGFELVFGSLPVEGEILDVHFFEEFLG
jgi:hypothetical protein